MLSLQVCLTQELSLTGGMTQSIFPDVEEIMEETDAQNAVSLIAPPARMNRFHSLVDFLLVEANADQAKGCFKFYDDKGPALRGMPGFGELERLRCQYRMLWVLRFALRNWEYKTRLSWRTVKRQADEAA